MVPHIKEKLTVAVEDLEMFLEDHEEDEDLKETELLENAKTQIQDAQSFLEGIDKEEDETEMTEDQGKSGQVEAEEDDDDEEMPMGEEEGN